jgi:trans-aconitate methyltransferase
VAALTYGNAAKLYCLRLLDEAIGRADGTFRIVDLGCGDGRNFVELLRRHPNVGYIGVDPSRRAIERAKGLLPNAQFVHAPAYDARFEPADAVVSLSVLEHVKDRKRYLEAVHANLAAAGRVYLNYDSGHFGPDATLSERTKAALARAVAGFGWESRYRARVHRRELSELLASVGLRVVDDKGFNTDVKVTCRVVPEAQRDLFMERWLAFEIALNDAGVGFDERVFRTRNLVLERD